MSEPAAGIIGNLPDRWALKETSEILKRVDGAIKIGPFGSQLRKEFFVEEGFKVYGQENVFKNDFSIGNRRISKPHFLSLASCELHPRDVVISMMGTIGKCSVVPEGIEPGIMDSHLLRLKVSEDTLIPELLAQMIADGWFVKAQLRQLSVGGIMEGLSSRVVQRLRFPVPPIAVQRRILDILSTLDETIEQTEALIAKCQQMKAGLMHDLFTRGVTPNGKFRPTRAEAPQLYKESHLGWIPKEWNVKYLADLYGNPIRDFGSFSSTNLITFLESGVPFIKSEMIGVGKISWDSVMFISDQVHNMLSKSHVQKGDILFSKIGSALGKAVVYDGSHGVCNSNAAIAKIDVDRKKATNFFVMYFLNHQTAQTQFKNMIVSLLPRINLGDINRLLVPVPPLAEQLVIENRLTAIDHALNSEEKLLNKQRLTKHGLMHDLLTGNVRVKVAEFEAA
jgi:type I restriction enzyme, S subunit